MKRFTETNKWDDPWFRGLKGVEKLVFLYVIDRCNNAGFWEIDEAGMVFHTKLSEAHIQGAWEGLNRGLIRVGAWVWVRRFLRHQKNESLNPENKAHVQIIALLREQIDRFDNEPDFQLFIAPYQPLFRGTGTGTGKGKEKKGSAEGKQSSIPVLPVELSRLSGFDEAWAEFIQHRREIKKPLTPLAAVGIMNSLLDRPNDAVAALETAVRRSWQGFEWAWFDKDRPKKVNGNATPEAFKVPMNKPPERPVGV